MVTTTAANADTITTAEAYDIDNDAMLTYFKVNGRYVHRVRDRGDQTAIVTSYTNHGIQYHVSRVGYTETVAMILTYLAEGTPTHWIGRMLG